MDKEHRFNTIFGEHESRIRAFLRVRCHHLPDVDAEDILQELRIKLWQLVQREKTLTNPASYLMQAAVSTLIDAQRRASVRRPEGGFSETDPDSIAAGSSDDTPERVTESRQDFEQLEGCMQRMAPDRARVVRLYLQGFGSAEISRMTGWTEPRCRNLLYRGLADLRGLMDNSDE